MAIFLNSLSFMDLLFYTETFAKMFGKCLISKETHGKYSKIQVSNTFKIIKLDKSFQNIRGKLDSGRTKISNMGLNELIRMIISFVTLFYC